MQYSSHICLTVSTERTGVRPAAALSSAATTTRATGSVGGTGSCNTSSNFLGGGPLKPPQTGLLKTLLNVLLGGYPDGQLLGFPEMLIQYV